VRLKRSAENLRQPDGTMKVTMDDNLGRFPMSYAEAKEIALLRLELRACWDTGDKQGAETALARLWQVVGNDNELAAEARRWSFKFAS
jgi:hypothetical protein